MPDQWRGIYQTDSLVVDERRISDDYFLLRIHLIQSIVDLWIYFMFIYMYIQIHWIKYIIKQDYNIFVF
jgi:hypothetical protein